MLGLFSSLDDVPPKNTKERQSYFLQKAAKTACKSDMSHRHGCVIVHGDTILAEGWNKSKTYYNHAFSIHAESDTIHRCRKKYKDIFSDVELYVVRIGPDSLDNCLKYSKPCDNCQKLICRFGIKRIFYSTNDESQSK